MIANHVTFESIANAIYHADTANWAETFDALTERVKSGFEDIAYRVEKKGGGNALVVSHGMTIAFLLHLINNENNVRMDIENGAVTRLIYENGTFTIAEVGSTDYIKKGVKLSQELLS